MTPLRGRQGRGQRRRIVVAFDGTQQGRAAVTEALRLARDGGRWEIVLVCAHERPPDFSRNPYTGKLIQPEDWASKWAEKVVAQMQHEVLRILLEELDASAVCSYEDAADLLLKVAREVGARWIVVPDDRRSLLYDLVLGSTTRRLLRASEIPVVSVPPVEDSAA